MDTDKPWHRDRAMLYTLTEHTDRYGRTSQVNDNWFCVQGPDAEAVAERIRLALAAPSAAGGGEIQGEASFLLARLREWENEHLTDESARDWWGHVAPSIERLEEFLASPSQGSDTGKAGREPGPYGIPGMPDCLRASDQLRIFSAYYADRLPTAAAAELVTMADEWDEEVEAARSPAHPPTAPQGADLAGLATWLENAADFDDQEQAIAIKFRHDDLTHYHNGRAEALREAVARVRTLVPTTSAPRAPADRDRIRIDYTNYRGERSIRTISVWGVEWESTEFHPEPQWLITGYDHDKHACRVYALRDIHAWNGVPTENPAALAHPGSVAPTSGERGGWSHDMAAVPAGEEIEVGAGRMIFLAKLVLNGSLTTEGESCDQWQATREGEHPLCWSDGCCWASNEDEDASLLPDRWRRVAPPLASQTEGERP